VDGGFRYSVPDEILLQVGSLVRVPLGPRRLRGFVVAVGEADPKRLKPIQRVLSDLPIFDPPLLETLVWLANHYVAPLSVVLGKPAPPNLPHRVPLPALARMASPGVDNGEARVGVISTDLSRLADWISPGLAGGGTAMVVAATVAEAVQTGDRLRQSFGSRVVVVHSRMPAAELTAIWGRARTQRGLVVVGTREVALWPLTELAVAIICDDGRPGMQERQTPALHVREVLLRRQQAEGFLLRVMGPVPTPEMVAYGIHLYQPGGRAWPRVEVADRRQDSGGLLGEQARRAIKAVMARGGRVFVLGQRSDAHVCRGCGTLRRCRACDSLLTASPNCPSCGVEVTACPNCGATALRPQAGTLAGVTTELKGLVGSDRVGEVGSGAAVQVGGEADLVRVTPVELAVVVDADSLLNAPDVRAPEQALRLMARVAGCVAKGTGRRCLVQTRAADDRVIQTLAKGDPRQFVEDELARRRRQGFPPAIEVLGLQITNPPPDLAEVLNRLGKGNEVWGPQGDPSRPRFLIRGADLTEVRQSLRNLIPVWRQAGAKVRVDAGPV